MEEAIKQDKSKSHKEFEKLLSQDLVQRKMREGEIITGVVSSIGKKHVFVDISGKSEGAIPIEEFTLLKEKIEIGSKIEVLLERIEHPRTGVCVLSREKARKARSWKKLHTAFENKKNIKGTILSRCKGGFIVSVESVLCFLPGSQIDLRPRKNFDDLMKTEQTFECVKMDNKRGNIVLSRRSVLEKSLAQDRSKIVGKMKVGDIVNGTVKNLTEWGCFVDIAGVDGLIHINEISWQRITNPSELLHISQPIKAVIIKIEEGTNKISLSIKKLSEDPFKKAINNFEVGKIYPAVVTNVQDYGCFARLAEGLEGLIHQSQLSWTKKNIHPGKVLSTSQSIKVQILEKDLLKRRLSLSYKNTLTNPWVKFKEMYKVGDKASGIVKNVVDFGLFVTIKDSELDGLVHYKDLSYRETETDLEKYKKSQPIEFVILEISQEKEKIRLGCKQLEKDPFTFFMSPKISVGTVVTVVVEFTSKNGIHVYAGGNKDLLLLIKRTQLAKEPENQRPTRWAKGDRVDCMIIELNKEKRKVTLSIKDLEEQEQKIAIKKFGSKDSGGTISDILGPLLKKKTKTEKK